MSDDWMAHANCADTDGDLFFPGSGFPGADEAKAICAACTVRETCLDYAIANKIEHGIWGGLAGRERRRIRRQRKASAA